MAEIFNWGSYTIVFTPSSDQDELEEIGYDFANGELKPWNVSLFTEAALGEQANCAAFNVILPEDYIFSSLLDIDYKFPGFFEKILDEAEEFDFCEYLGHVEDNVFELKDFYAGLYGEGMQPIYCEDDVEEKNSVLLKTENMSKDDSSIGKTRIADSRSIGIQTERMFEREDFYVATFSRKSELEYPEFELIKASIEEAIKKAVEIVQTDEPYRVAVRSARSYMPKNILTFSHGKLVEWDSAIDDTNLLSLVPDELIALNDDKLNEDADLIEKLRIENDVLKQDLMTVDAALKGMDASSVDFDTSKFEVDACSISKIIKNMKYRSDNPLAAFIDSQTDYRLCSDFYDESVFENLSQEEQAKAIKEITHFVQENVHEIIDIERFDVLVDKGIKHVLGFSPVQKTEPITPDKMAEALDKVRLELLNCGIPPFEGTDGSGPVV